MIQSNGRPSILADLASLQRAGDKASPAHPSNGL